jgi:hypothetical protein
MDFIVNEAARRFSLTIVNAEIRATQRERPALTITVKDRTGNFDADASTACPARHKQKNCSRDNAKGIMRKHATILIVAAAFTLGGLAGAFALLAQTRGSEATTTASDSAWREVAWPFPMDQWGKGTAFECRASGCGADVTVYLRAKIGFCNCKGGLADDTDLDRVSDFDLFGGALYAQAPGQPISVAWLKGRVRPFAIRNGWDDATMLSVGLHDHCDALVVTAVLSRGKLAQAEPKVRGFLNSKTVARWAEDALGL